MIECAKVIFHRVSTVLSRMFFVEQNKFLLAFGNFSANLDDFTTPILTDFDTILTTQKTLDNRNKLRENLSENRGEQMTNNEFAAYLLNRILILICRKQGQILSGSTLHIHRTFLSCLRTK